MGMNVLRSCMGSTHEIRLGSGLHLFLFNQEG